MQISYAALWLFTSWDIATNAALVAFPIVILTNARLSHREKTRAALRFAVISLTIWMSVVRSTSSYLFHGVEKLLWLHVWGSVQNCTIIVIGNGLAIRSQLQWGTSVHTRPLNFTRSPTPRGSVPLDAETAEVQIGRLEIPLDVSLHPT